MDNRVRNSRWLTIQQVALRLHVSRDTVERWINAGSLKAVDVSTRSALVCHRRCWRIPAESLEAFLERRAISPAAHPPAKVRIRPREGVIEFIK
jgi:excisionase family DNA binding protein